jgi:uncharacterized membrane protein YphA (DoxX/SURF4 family)
MKNIIEKLRIPDIQKLLLRFVLGFVFFISGFKIAFPSDVAALATSYANPDKGWISPYFIDWITNTLGLDVGTYLFYQGVLEMLMGTALIIGFFTTLVGIGMGVLYWAFTVANPIAGEIRLSRDIALTFFTFGLAYYGAGRYSVDAKISRLYREGRQEVLRFALRFGLGFTFVLSALFTGGVMNSPLNTTVPVVIVFVLGVMLLLNVKVKWVALATILFLLYAIGDTMASKELIFKMFDGTKRELAFLVGAIILFVTQTKDSILSFETLRIYK